MSDTITNNNQSTNEANQSTTDVNTTNDVNNQSLNNASQVDTNQNSLENTNNTESNNQSTDNDTFITESVNAESSGEEQPKVEDITYEFKPFGENTEVSQEDIATYTSLAKELKLSQEQAQRLYELGSDTVRARQTQELNAISSHWREELITDTDIGGNNLNETRKNVALVLNKYGSEELVGFLQNSKLGNYPPLIKMLNQVGKQFREDDQLINGNNNAKVSSREEMLKNFYNNSPELN